jgi:hypothetical protein
MTTLWRILIATVVAAGISGVASADIVVGYETTLGPTNTDLLNSQIVLPAFDPGSTNSTASNISGNGYTAGISMSSLNPSLFNYTLVGYNISVKETLSGSYTVTNNRSVEAIGSVYIDTYTAVALNGALSPGLTAVTDPANDLFNCSVTGTGASPCPAPGEQSTSVGGGPDPNSAVSSVAIASGGSQTFSVDVNSGWVDYGCEIFNQAFCNEPSANSAIGYVFPFGLSDVETGIPNLTFFISTNTEINENLTSGFFLTPQYNTQVKEQVEVTYDYSVTPISSVPEPGSMLLFGSAAAGVFLIVRRRASRV